MVNGEAGKGDKYRKLDRKKYDLGYLRIFGKECDRCHGKDRQCLKCGGIGWTEKNK